MALKFSDRLESNNPSAYGIVKAIEVAGHKTVSSLSALCNIPDCILSLSGNNTDNDAIGQLWYVVEEGRLFQLLDWENRKSQSGWEVYGEENVTKEELEELLEGKQDKLVAGSGINITEDNVISCTLDTKIFEFVDELPPLTEAKDNKIYLVPKDNGQGENQVYVEYIVVSTVDDSGFPTKEWEKIGEYDLGIELTPYLKKEEAETIYVKKADIVNTTEGGTNEQVLGAQVGKDLSDRIDQISNNTVNSVTATPEKGIIIEGTKSEPTVGILRDPESEDFLSLGEGGLKLSGVQESIDQGDNSVREEYKNGLSEMQLHTEVLYNVNTLFPGEGQGDNSDQWTLTRALIKLDTILEEADKVPGVKIKFIDLDGNWKTYTFKGGDDFLDENSWSYDLTSNDISSLASQIPEATDTTPGMMSAEDKKLLGELSEGIEPGNSILDEIGNAVQEAKETIDSYTVNGHKISENPVLTKEDVGLGEVDNTSDLDKPISTATQEALDGLEEKTDPVYNINSLFPDSGTGENKDHWNLQSAIVRLDAELNPEDKKAGINIKFITESGNWRTYTFKGGDSITNTENWKYDLTSEDFESLATSDLPVATPESNGVMSKEDKALLDELSEGIEPGKSVVEVVTEKVQEAKDVIDSYTVNGHKISENPVLTKEDVGLGNVTDDAQVKRTEMGVAGGVATLGDDGKVPSSQLPDSVLGNVKYMGLWDASTNDPLLENGNPEENGHYYIVNVAGAQFGYDFEQGDWVINSDGTWSKVDNVDAVKSVNGKTGIVVVEIQDIQGLREDLDSRALQVDLESHLTDHENPHQVTKEQVGLGNVENLAPADLPISTATQEALDGLKEKIDPVYNVNTLFPGEGQGDNNDQWDLRHAIIKLSENLEPGEKIPGVKVKFLTSSGIWETYTLENSDFVTPESWVKDLSSNDIPGFASQIPVATPESNGVMSKEDKALLDKLSEGMESEVSIPEYVDSKVNEAKEELSGAIDQTNTNLESHLTNYENPHQVTKDQVGLGNVTNDAQVKRTEMGIPEGVATLGKDGKVPNEQIPNRLLNNVKYLGLWNASTNIPEIINNTPENSGNYYVVDTAGIQFGYDFEPGDWVINNGGTWTKVDNTEKVTSVNGKTGDIIIGIQDIQGLYDELSKKALGTDLEALSGRTQVIEDQIGKPSGIATLDGDGQLVKDQIPEEAVNVLLGTLVNNTTFNNNTGSAYKPLLGVIYVDTVTNKLYRWGEYSYIELVTLDGVDSEISSHIQDYNNPHRVTKEQIGLENVTNDAQVKRTEMGVAGGVATLNESGKIPVGQLPGQTDEVFGIDHFVATKTDIPGTRLVVGVTYYVEDEKKIYTAISETELDSGKTPEKGVIYSNRDTNLIYRWDGAELVSIGNPVTIGESAGEAYPGDKGKETTDNLNAHLVDYENPHQVTKEQLGLGNVENLAPADLPVSSATQTAIDEVKNAVDSYTVNGYKISENPVLTKEDVGLGKVDNTSDLEKPISTATQAAIDELKKDLSGVSSSHIQDYNNPHKVTKEQIGLGNVDNTADLNKPVSVAQQAAIDSAKADLNTLISQVKNLAENHIANVDNPHQVNKEDVGLGKVDNTADLEKPVSVAQQAAINKVKDSVSEVSTDLGTHIKDYNNPHRVTKEQVGLGKVDNTSDLEKPISTAQQEAIKNLESSIELTKETVSNYTISGHKISENPTLTKEDVGLGNVDNTSDINKPISHLTQDALDALSGRIDSINQTTGENLTTHLVDYNNPHKVTKDQVGLGNVENLAPADLPVSEATQEAINDLREELSNASDAHLADHNNPHQVTKEQIGLGNVTDDAQVKRSEMGVAGGVATLGEDGKVPSGQLPSFVDDVLEFDSLEEFPEKGESGKIYVAKDTNLSYRWSGTRYIEISKSIGLGETSSTAYPGDKGKTTTEKLEAHLSDFDNPHQVTKEQVGLGNVENIAPADLPLSNAAQEAISEIKETITSGNAEISEALEAHIGNTSNPHNVTKEQLGLDKVDNTSDLDKPISTATQTAIDEVKESIKTSGDSLSAHLIDFNNPHRITKAQLGLDKVDNTGDLEKPVSNATQAKLDSLQDKIDEIKESQTSGLTSHLTDFNNPHRVTKEQVGLGKVDNTSDLEKPVSTAQQKAISDAKAELNTSLTSHINSTNNPHQVTKAQVGLDQVDNTSDANKPVSGPQQQAITSLGDKLTASITAHTGNTSNPHQVTKEQIGLGKVENLSPSELPVSTATEKLITETKNELQGLIQTGDDSMTKHIEDYNNPHKVSKEQIGLGNVENLAPSDLPISTATQEALDGKVDKTEDGLIDETQLPKRTMHSMFYKGLWDADDNNPVLSNNSIDSDGDYYIVNTGGSRFGYDFKKNDIVFNASGSWYRLMGSQERDLDVDFEILKFEADQYKFEKGTKATVNFSWEYQLTPEGQVTFQNINQYNVPVTERTYSISDVTGDTTFILNSSFYGQTAQKSLDVKFYNKLYIGISKNDTVTDLEIQGMDSYFVDGVTSAPFKVYDCSGGNYIYIAIPKVDYERYAIFCNGILVNDTIDTTRTVVNAASGSDEYVISRLRNKFNGTLGIEVKLL